MKVATLAMLILSAKCIKWCDASTCCMKAAVVFTIFLPEALSSRLLVAVECGGLRSSLHVKLVDRRVTKFDWGTCIHR